MLWPSRSDYAQAVDFFPHISILDPELRGGNPRRGFNNYLMVYTGGFSIVFPVEMISDIYALRCWIVDIGDAETRYREISDYLKQCRLPYFVDFAYVPEGILVNGIKYPVTRMEWAEGDTLCDFIEHNLQDARCLKTAAAEFQKMVADLHTHQISHGDLQDGNILLKRTGTDVEIKLIDYDSVFVPALCGHPDTTIVGVPAYQHPQRIACGVGAAKKMDYFSELVIYLSLLSLAEKPDLWSQFGAPTERRLLFVAEDFKNPDQSDVFRELESLSPDVKQLASKLKEFCKRSVDQLEPLEAVLPQTSPAQVAYNQGLTYLHNNRYNEAIVEFEKAIGLDPNYKEAHHGLGLAHLKMGNLGEAKRKAERALGIDPHYQPAHQLLDAVKSFKPPPVTPPPPVPPGQTSSKGTFNLRHYLPPNLWQYVTGALAFILMVCIVVLAMQLSEKDEVLRRATQRFSNEKAQLLGKNQRLQNELTERDKETTTQIAIAKRLRSEKEELLNQNQELRNENTMLQNQSERGSTTSAIRTLSNEKAQLLRENERLQNKLTEQDEETRTQIAIAERLRSEKEELRSQLTEQNKETKTQIAIAEQLRSEKEKLHSQNRKLQNENKTLREQLGTRKPQPVPLQKIYHNSIPRVDSTAMSKNNQGCIEFDRGKYNRAIELFEDAINSDSQSAVIYYNLGSTYLKMMEYTKAVNYLQKGIKFNPEFKEAHYNLALALGKGTVK